MLKVLWEKWKIVAHKIGDFQARLILGIFYFVLLAPFALAIKFFTDPLHIKVKEAIGWCPYPSSEEDPAARARRQF
jgi:hypothetical protein